jgi:hypothetical protein
MYPTSTALPLYADFPSGANTDLLGRRWFLVGGNVFCFIGHLVVATAKSNKAVIVGMGLSPLHWQQQLRR